MAAGVGTLGRRLATSSSASTPSANAAPMITNGACQPRRDCTSNIAPPPTIAPTNKAAARMLPARTCSWRGSHCTARALSGMSIQVATMLMAKVMANSARRCSMRLSRAISAYSTISTPPSNASQRGNGERPRRTRCTGTAMRNLNTAGSPASWNRPISVPLQPYWRMTSGRPNIR